MSRPPGPTEHDPFVGHAPARTPGALGRNDAGDPDVAATAGDTPGPLGINDYGALLANTGPSQLGIGRPIAGPPNAGALPVGVDDVVKTVTSCATGKALFAKAKAANNKKNLVIKLGKTEFGGFVDTDTGVITLDSRLNKCTAIDALVQELTNLASKPDFDKLDEETIKGNVSRADYIRRTEQIEFRGLLNILKVFDETKARTGCRTCSRVYQRKYAKSFDAYYKYMLSDEYGKAHGEKIGARWDRGAKEAYEKKHPKK